jgi:rhamnosyltransferase
VDESVVAVVPTFRPESGELNSLVASLQAQVISVLVTDDASPCTSDPALRGVESLGVDVVRHRHNRGIARGLNDGLSFAVARRATWLLTVDQDSSLPPGYVAALLAAATDRVGVIGAEIISDASGDVRYPTTQSDGHLTTEEVFQTGSLWSVAALTAIGGFDESLGIDAVDAAACLRLRERGFIVALAAGVRLEHRVGAARQVTLLGRTVLATGHSPERRTTMVRNRLRLAPAEFRQSPKHAFRTLRRVGVNAVLGATVEENRWAKTKGTIKGLLPRRSR